MILTGRGVTDVSRLYHTGIWDITIILDLLPASILVVHGGEMDLSLGWLR